MVLYHYVIWVASSLILLSLHVALAQSPAQPAPATKEPDPIVARINQHDIRLSYVYRKIESLPLGDQVDIRERLPRFVESVIQEEILFQSMLSTNFHDQPDLRAQVKAIVVDSLIQTHVQDQIKISDEAIQQYYHDNASLIRGENIHVYQILLSTRDECEVMRPKIDSDTTFAHLAQTHSLDPASAPKGGDLGQFMAHPGPLGFELTWFDMSVGEMRIFDSPQGCHLIRVVDRETPPLPPLEDVRDRIQFLLQRNQEVALLRALIDKHANQLPVERMKLPPPSDP